MCIRDSVNSNQLIVRALLNDLAVIDHEYPVGMVHSFQPVGNHNDRLIVGQFRNSLHQLLFIFGVNIRLQSQDGQQCISSAVNMIFPIFTSWKQA